jgi:hypothetical protein
MKWEKEMKTWIEDVGLKPMKEGKKCLTCETIIYFDKELKCAIGGVNLVSYAGPLSKYRDINDYGSFSEKIHFYMCDKCLKRNVKHGLNANSLQSGKFEQPELKKKKPVFDLSTSLNRFLNEDNDQN